MSKRFYILTLTALTISACSYAQTNKLVREGNKLYEQQKYKEAAADYQKALVKNPTYTPGLFNLGNSLYQQKQFDASRQVMAATAKASKDKGGKAAANYNIGNSYMQEQKWEDAVNAYKQTLRNNPQDADAKYNLSYAEEMMKKKQGGGGKNNKQNKDQQKQDQKDKSQQNKDQQNKDPQNKDQQDKDKQDQDQQHPQSQPSKLSQQQADQLLNALQQEEKKLQDKQKKEKGVPVKMEKDW